MYTPIFFFHIKNGDCVKIKEIMTKDMVVAYPDTTLEAASNMMRNYDIGFLPIEKEEDFIGVITDRDIVIRAIALGKSYTDTVEQYMTGYIISIASEEEIEEALELMAEEKVKRLMVEENKKLVGMISLSDILQVKKDEETLEYVTRIFSPIENAVITNEIDIPQAEIDEFEL